MITPVLETKHLILRPLTVADAEEAFKNWTSDPDVSRFMRWNTHENVDVTREWLTLIEQNTASDTSYDWGFVRKSDNKLIGSGGLYYNERHKGFEIGYCIMKDCWHQGYTSEAAAAMITFAFQILKETTLYACHVKENVNSGKVMEKAGFHYVQDGHLDSFDNQRHYETRKYVLKASEFIHR